MKRQSKKPCLWTVLTAVVATPLGAQDRSGLETYAVTLENLNIRPVTINAAERTLVRIEEAALEVCGVPRGSLRHVRRAVRKSACWRDSVDRAVSAIGDPLLNRVHQRGQ